MRWVGHDLYAEAGATADPHATLNDGHALAHEAEDQLRAALPRLSSGTVHVGPQPAASSTLEV